MFEHFFEEDEDEEDDDIDLDLDVNSMSCCGVKEVDGIDGIDPKKVVKYLKEYRKEYETTPPFFIFTGITNERYGQKLKRYIEKNKLGRVFQSSSKKNPNSGNFISVFVWEVNSKILDK